MEEQTRKAGQKVGKDRVYQGRFESFAVETNESVRTMCRSVERNLVCAGLVAGAGQWRWSSAGQCGSERGVVFINDWPIVRHTDRVHWDNQSELQEQSAAECAQEPTVWDLFLGRADGFTAERTMPGQGPLRIGLVN